MFIVTQEVTSLEFLDVQKDVEILGIARTALRALKVCHDAYEALALEREGLVEDALFPVAEPIPTANYLIYGGLEVTNGSFRYRFIYTQTVVYE